MKKALLFGGLALAGFGMYRYFKYQIDKALNYDYKIKDFKIDKIEGSDVTISTAVEIKNRSSFKIKVREYDLQLAFKGVNFANTRSSAEMEILPESAFILKTSGVISLDKAKTAVAPFVSDIFNKKPINVEISGFVKVVFLGIPSTIKFDKQQITYSQDLLADFKLDKGFDKLKQKYPKVFSALGIK
jgi:LEA14-like dessication related protein